MIKKFKQFKQKIMNPKVYSLVFKDKENERRLLWVVGAYSLEEALRKATSQIEKEMKGIAEISDFKIDLFSCDSVDTLLEEYVVPDTEYKPDRPSRFNGLLIKDKMLHVLKNRKQREEMEVKEIKKSLPQLSEKKNETPSLEKNKLMKKLIEGGDLDKLKEHENDFAKTEYKYIDDSIKSQSKSKKK